MCASFPRTHAVYFLPHYIVGVNSNVTLAEAAATFKTVAECFLTLRLYHAACFVLPQSNRHHPSISFLQFQPKPVSRLGRPLGPWHTLGVGSLLPEAGLFAATSVSKELGAGKGPSTLSVQYLFCICFVSSFGVSSASPPSVVVRFCAGSAKC